ncbi:MAG: hypothetical protein JWR52_3032 [Marmoricola sp.]|nr:hypothetical protein [Marmoricola sp.]
MGVDDGLDWTTDELTQGSGRVTVLRAIAVTWTAMRRKGLRTTAQLVVRHVPAWMFDLRYGVRTIGHQGVNDLPRVGDSEGYPYLGSNPRDLRRALRQLGNGGQGTFVDLGCGKGRALVIAALEGHRSVVGVDFIAEFCEAAEENFAAFKKRTGSTSEAQVLNLDAATYLPTEDDTTFFFFNPFPADVLAAVVQNIYDSWLAHPRDVWVIYHCAAHPEVFEDSLHWRRAGESKAQYPTVSYVPVAPEDPLPDA